MNKDDLLLLYGPNYQHFVKEDEEDYNLTEFIDTSNSPIIYDLPRTPNEPPSQVPVFDMASEIYNIEGSDRIYNGPYQYKDNGCTLFMKHTLNVIELVADEEKEKKQRLDVVHDNNDVSLNLNLLKEKVENNFENRIQVIESEHSNVKRRLDQQQKKIIKSAKKLQEQNNWSHVISEITKENQNMKKQQTSLHNIIKVQTQILQRLQEKEQESTKAISMLLKQNETLSNQIDNMKSIIQEQNKRFIGLEESLTYVFDQASEINETVKDLSHQLDTDSLKTSLLLQIQNHKRRYETL